MIIKCNLDSILLSKHFTRHKSIEDGSTRQRHAEVETEKPPIFGWLIKLEFNKDTKLPLTSNCYQSIQVCPIIMYHVQTCWSNYCMTGTNTTTWGLFKVHMQTDLHELVFLHRVEQANPKQLSFVVHCDHIKSDGLWHCKYYGQHPYQNDFNSCPFGDADAFDAVPRCHCSKSWDNGQCQMQD